MSVIAPSTVRSEPWPSQAIDRDRTESIVRLAKVVVFTAVFAQRIGLPAGAAYVSVVLPVILIGGTYLRLTNRLIEDPVRTALFLLAAIMCLASTLANVALGSALSMTSLGLLLVTYMPFIWRSPDLGRRDAEGALSQTLVFFVHVMVVVAVVAVTQLVAQVAGVWTYSDLLARIVPTKLLIPGYHTSYPDSYGSNIYKSNGLFMLEPSFCSQFMALAVIATIKSPVSRKPLLVGLFLAALVCTTSGTGVVLLVVGLLAEGARRQPKVIVRGAAVLGVAVVLLLHTPVGKIYSDRAHELRNPTSSGNQRFVAPYVELRNALGDSARSALVGQGAGFADRNDANVSALTGAPLTSPPLIKLILEYGLVAGATFAAAIMCGIWRRTPSRSLALTATVFVFLLSDSLLQPQTLFVAWSFTTAFAFSRGVERPGWVPETDAAPSSSTPIV